MSLYFICILFCFIFHETRCSNYEVVNSVMQNDAINVMDVDITFCQDSYPFSYAKCLRICSPILEPTCLDDDLCVCDINTFTFKSSIQRNQNSLEDTLGVAVDAVCKSHKFCRESCETTFSQTGQSFRDGVLCVQTTKDFGLIKMCVCNV